MKLRQAFLAAPLAIIMSIIAPPLFIGPLEFEEWLHLYSAWVVLVALPGAFLFPFMYARVAWWRSHLGRAVMMMAIGIAGIIINASLRVLSAWPNVEAPYEGDPVSIDLYRLILFLEITIAIYYKTLALHLVSRKGMDLHEDDAEQRHLDGHSSEESVESRPNTT